MLNSLVTKLTDFWVASLEQEMHDLATQSRRVSMKAGIHGADAQLRMRVESKRVDSGRLSREKLFDLLMNLSSFSAVKLSQDAVKEIELVLSSLHRITFWRAPIFTDPRLSEDASSIISSAIRALEARKMILACMLCFHEYYLELISEYERREFVMETISEGKASSRTYRGAVYFEEISVSTDMEEAAAQAASYSQTMKMLSERELRLDDRGQMPEVDSCKLFLKRFFSLRFSALEQQTSQTIFQFFLVHARASKFFAIESDSKVLEGQQSVVKAARDKLLSAIKVGSQVCIDAYRLKLDSNQRQIELLNRALNAISGSEVPTK